MGRKRMCIKRNLQILFPTAIKRTEERASEEEDLERCLCSSTIGMLFPILSFLVCRALNRGQKLSLAAPHRARQNPFIVFFSLFRSLVALLSPPSLWSI